VKETRKDFVLSKSKNIKKKLPDNKVYQNLQCTKFCETVLNLIVSSTNFSRLYYPKRRKLATHNDGTFVQKLKTAKVLQPNHI